MGKQKRGPERDEATPGVAPRATARPALDPSLVDQGMLGNAALQASLDGAAVAPVGPDLDVVRDVARPMVDHASLVLQLTHNPLHDRLVDILDASLLPADRKQVLLDRLDTHAAAAGVVHQALLDAFGADTASLRAALSDALDAVHDALSTRGHDQGAWLLPDRAAPLSDATLDAAAPVTARAGSLVRDLTAPLAPAVDPAGARSFCLAVHLALTLDEEEEEDAIDDLRLLDA